MRFKLVNLGFILCGPGWAILEQDSVLVDRNFLLMMKDAFLGRCNSLISLTDRSDKTLPANTSKKVEELYQAGDELLKKCGSDAYLTLKKLEPLCIRRLQQLARDGRPLIPEDDRFRKYLDNVIFEASGDHAALYDKWVPLLNQTENPEVILVFFGSFRHWGHPFIDYLKGLEKLYNRVTAPKEISKEFANQLASDLAKKILTAKFKEKKRWYLKPGTTPKTHPLHKWIEAYEWPFPKEILDAGDVWADLDLDKCFEVPDLVDQSQLYSDKTHSMNRSEVIQHVKFGQKRPIPTRKVLKTLVERPATNWNEFLKDIDLNGIDKEALIIGLKEKERELNEAGRFFAMMSWQLREYFVITEFLIKQHFVPYFSGLIMADDLTELQKKMLDATTEQGGSNYDHVSFCNHADYEKWNNDQRHDATYPVFRVMDQFLGFNNLISRTHKIFESCLIYYGKRPDLMRASGNSLENTSETRVCWEGQAGGLEGLRQGGWTMIGYLTIDRASRIRNTQIKVLAQGDNQVICTFYKKKKTRNEVELKEELHNMFHNNKAIMEKIETKSKSLGLKIKPEETMVSADLIIYGKIPIF